MTTRVEFAARLEHYANEVRRIRGVGSKGPHAFVEDKSEIIAAMTAEARELRMVALPASAATKVGTIAPGRRQVGDRRIDVVSKSRRA